MPRKKPATTRSRSSSKGYADYLGQPFGLARIMDESPFSDGSAAQLIENFHVDERGFLVNNPRVMRLIPEEWSDTFDQMVEPQFPQLFGDLNSALSKTIAMSHMKRDGEIPELIFLTTFGVFRFTPWSRVSPNQFGNNVPGLTEQFYYQRSGGKQSVKPAGKTRFPPQMEVVANKMYFTFGDGGTVWVWDGQRIRNVGFSLKPSPPNAKGPMRGIAGSTGQENTGGGSHAGRIGNAESNWTEEVGSTPVVQTVGGVDVGHWRYAVVFEGPDGEYSPMSDPGGHVSMRKQTCRQGQFPDELLKKFRVFDIPRGPDNCAARILLRTRNLERLPPGDDGSFRFLHRIPNADATEYVDDIPDGDLGSAWQDREAFPLGPYFIRHFSGSLFYASTDGYPSRVWWSEQDPEAGPIPESILYGHWLEVFPETGPITAVYSATLPGQSGVPILLIFKENATHFIAGQYPKWQAGTVHNTAGCAGPGCIQAGPGGEVIWYGANTFWKMDKEGIVDIGVTIRKRLQRINRNAANMGQSWFDSSNREMVFWLPLDDNKHPNQGFVWDYAANGWRLLSTLKDVKATLSIPSESLVLANATYGDEEDVWVYGRSYPLDELGSDTSNPAVYISGWLSLSDFGPEMHAAKRAAWLVVTGEDHSNGAAEVSVFRNHNGIYPATDIQGLSCSHPEEEVAYYGSATYYEFDGDDVWRESRVFATQLPIDAPNARSIQVKIKTYHRMSLFNIDLYGPVTTGPFSRGSGGEG